MGDLSNHMCDKMDADIAYCAQHPILKATPDISGEDAARFTREREAIERASKMKVGAKIFVIVFDTRWSSARGKSNHEWKVATRKEIVYEVKVKTVTFERRRKAWGRTCYRLHEKIDRCFLDKKEAQTECVRRNEVRASDSNFRDPAWES